LKHRESAILRSSRPIVYVDAWFGFIGFTSDRFVSSGS